ncbi:MAG: GAF domain-containing protein, partial [Deltaproteobacteria bacterium]
MPLVASEQRNSLLQSVAGLLSKQVTLQRLLDSMVEVVVRSLDAERGTLYLVDSSKGRLVSISAKLPEMDRIVLEPGRGIAGHVAKTGEPVVVPDTTKDTRFFAGIDEKTGFRTRNMLVVPVRRTDGTICGVLQVLNLGRGNLGKEQLGKLENLADSVAEALSLTSFMPAGQGRKGVELSSPFNNIVGTSPAMKEVYRMIESAAATDVTVLLTGETGTGKNLLARAIHHNSARASGPLVQVDCAGLPAGIVESELFGHERGAFTGAERRVEGKFEQAHGGTLLLDEVGDLALPLQGKLLRFLQERSFERLGGGRTVKVDVRVIAATNADLESLVQRRLFRRDLYYRLKVLRIEVPPLRDRGSEDILSLAEFFLERYAERHRRPARRFS